MRVMNASCRRKVKLFTKKKVLRASVLKQKNYEQWWLVTHGVLISISNFLSDTECLLFNHHTKCRMEKNQADQKKSILLNFFIMINIKFFKEFWLS